MRRGSSQLRPTSSKQLRLSQPSRFRRTFWRNLNRKALSGSHRPAPSATPKTRFLRVPTPPTTGSARPVAPPGAIHYPIQAPTPPDCPSRPSETERAARQQGSSSLRENSSNGGKTIRTFWLHSRFGERECQGEMRTEINYSLSIIYKQQAARGGILLFSLSSPLKPRGLPSFYGVFLGLGLLFHRFSTRH